jgi:hypothetical protein
MERLRALIPLRETPLAFFYADTVPADAVLPSGEHTCVVALMSQAREGATLAVARDNFGCGGGGFYLGFCPPRPGIAEFVSTGIPGQMEGEHYKQSPQLAQAHLDRHPVPPAPADYAVMKPVADLGAHEAPQVVIYFGSADELAALVFLANYARAEEAVITPFGSGCSSTLTRPLLEAQREHPRAILGLFDPSARPHLGSDEFSFAAPAALWEEMLGNAEESFLRTPTWDRLRRRIEEKE